MSEKIIVNSSQITAKVIVGHSTNGVPASGFGVGIDTSILFQADSSVISLRDIGQISFEWEIATDSSRRSVCVIEVAKDGQLIEVARINSNGEIATRKA